MSRLPLAAFAAALVAASFARAPAAADQATLKVTAHVENRCTVAVPPWIASSEWRSWRHRPGHFVSHSCGHRPPFWVQAREGWWRHGSGGQKRLPWRQERTRHPTRPDVVMITITY